MALHCSAGCWHLLKCTQSHNTHSDPFCLCSMRTSDGMTNKFTSVPTFSVNGFNYHDRTLEDKRGNDLARLSGEPRSRWPGPARSAGTASISPLFLFGVLSDKIEEPINDDDVPHLRHSKFSVSYRLWWWGRGAVAGAYTNSPQARDVSITWTDHNLVTKRTQPFHLGAV